MARFGETKRLRRMQVEGLRFSATSLTVQVVKGGVLGAVVAYGSAGMAGTANSVDAVHVLNASRATSISEKEPLDRLAAVLASAGGGGGVEVVELLSTEEVAAEVERRDTTVVKVVDTLELEGRAGTGKGDVGRGDPGARLDDGGGGAVDAAFDLLRLNVQGDVSLRGLVGESENTVEGQGRGALCREERPHIVKHGESTGSRGGEGTILLGLGARVVLVAVAEKDMLQLSAGRRGS